MKTTLFFLEVVRGANIIVDIVRFVKINKLSLLKLAFALGSILNNINFVTILKITYILMDKY
jgi:hypothetical protein